MEINNLLDNSQVYLNKKDKQFAIDLLNEAKSSFDKIEDKSIWKDFLNISYLPEYLQLLPDYETRLMWSDLVLKIIRKIDFSLLDLFEQRVSKHPHKVLFKQKINDVFHDWTYEKIHSYTKEIASGILKITNNNARAAIFSENSVQSASADLACLFYDIPVSPLNINFKESEIADIIEMLDVNVIFTDTKERYRKLCDIRNDNNFNFTIILTKENLVEYKNDIFLGSYLRSFSGAEADSLLANRNRLKLNEVATVMFTSGSTGKPKGISFSIYNLVSKRFCRGAALENVGTDEVMVCYLPLFHTFGRFLEMLGTIYWNGTYVFTGNTSTETLMKMFSDIQPSVFISVPLRWMQLESKAMKEMNDVVSEDDKLKAFRSVTGKRLKWGLSAAGYLDPKTFRFFRHNGVELCSGFGMTEGTGGITMTPPGEYIDDSVGIPLPGIELKLAEHNELQIKGHYVARYFDDKKLGDIIPYPEDDDYWLPTGDVFEKMENGHYKIVDRLKDIYKNNKGQTVAPRNVENKFTGVPGIKTTFLVGDGKPYNVLFIVPDKEDTIIFNEPSDTVADYYKQIVRAANEELPTYERVVNYTVLDREFSLERGELTPKGSFNRKMINHNFSDEIEKLYLSDSTIIEFEDFKVKIPRWFYRDLSILENDIIKVDNGLYNTGGKQTLTIKKLVRNDVEDYYSYQIGDFEYKIKEKTIDLGRIVRQPSLWLANIELMKFSPYKYGWDTAYNSILNHTFLIIENYNKYKDGFNVELKKNKDSDLEKLNLLFLRILFNDDEDVLAALFELSKILSNSDEKLSKLIRLRIEMLARHESEEIRTTAYRILLLDEPNPDYSHTFPAFLASSKKFLNQKSMHEIATGKLERRRLEALRKRLYSYRQQLKWPQDEKTVKLFEDIFALLLEYIKVHPEYYTSVRYELTNWMLHNEDPVLADKADLYFQKLYSFYEYNLDAQIYNEDDRLWEERLVFDEVLNQSEIDILKKVLVGTAFIKQSVLLAFDERRFDIIDVEKDGIWISRLETASTCRHYRVSVNTKSKDHYEFQIFVNDVLNSEKALEGIYWHIIISGYPFGPRVVPRLGAVRPELNARSVEYMNELSVWNKIRQYASQRIKGEDFSKTDALRTLFTEAITAFFRGWFYTKKQIVPGFISPGNVIVPELDYREGATINSLTGWKYYTSPLSLIEPIIKNFYEKTTHHYSWIFDQINLKWIFDAIIEAVGINEAYEFIADLKNELNEKSDYKYKDKVLNAIDEYYNYLEIGFYEPLALIKSIKRYLNWEADNAEATAIAKEETLIEISRLYRLNRYPEIIRYVYYRDTYFRNADEKIVFALNELIKKMIEVKNVPATNLIELSKIQNLLVNETDRHVFSRMVYPNLQTEKDIDVLTTGDGRRRQVILQSHFKDKFGIIYNFREPKNPSEIGLLYRLFFKEKYPKMISDLDEYFIVTDSIERVIGGICYKIVNEEEVFLDGSVVQSSVKGRGIGRAMLNDFCGRMANQGIKVIKTNFFMKQFYSKIGFTSDKSRGALVKFITPEISENVKGEYCKIM